MTPFPLLWVMLKEKYKFLHDAFPVTAGKFQQKISKFLHNAFPVTAGNVLNKKNNVQAMKITLLS